jgi:peptide subunit release factor 1 (eRF1)
MDDTVLLRYLDGELDLQASQAVTDRLRYDPALRRRVAELRAVEAAYGSMSDENLPAERREALLERLRREPPAPPYDLVRRSDLEALAQLRNANAPVFSLYLDLDPERRVSEPPLSRFKSLLRQAKQLPGKRGEELRPGPQSRAYRKQWEEEADRLRACLETQQPLQGRGLAVLSSLSAGLWRAFRLPVPVRDRLEVADRPYLRPLAALLDEFEGYLVVLIDSGRARFIETRLGTAEEVADVESDVPPATGNISEKTGHRHDTSLHRHAKSVAMRTEGLWRRLNCDGLVIGGTEEALGELRDQLPNALRERLAGELHLSPKVEIDHILDRVLEIEREHERRVEAQRVEELITTAHKSGPAVLGLETTLLAIVEGRVRLLVVEEEFNSAGWECPNCGFIGAAQQEFCPLCGTALNAQPDVVELALERVLNQDGDIEVLRSPESRQALAQYGRIGALLRYGWRSPLPVKEDELSDQTNAAQEGTTNREELIDEALKETFPASDPPFWMPYGGLG